jgi:hypothetical protein
MTQRSLTKRTVSNDKVLDLNSKGAEFESPTGHHIQWEVVAFLSPSWQMDGHYRLL